MQLCKFRLCFLILKQTKNFLFSLPLEKQNSVIDIFVDGLMGNAFRIDINVYICTVFTIDSNNNKSNNHNEQCH